MRAQQCTKHVHTPRARGDRTRVVRPGGCAGAEGAVVRLHSATLVVGRDRLHARARLISTIVALTRTFWPTRAKKPFIAGCVREALAFNVVKRTRLKGALQLKGPS